jgi:uncharacterized membrane protein YhaH (DUF805 family)
MERLRDLLRFDGRLSRIGYWRSYLTLVVAMAITWCVALYAAIHAGGFAAILFLPVAPIIVASLAISVRRLHDRGKSGWWTIPLVIFPQVVAFDRAAETRGASPDALLALATLLALGLTIWAWVEIGFRRGTPGPNRFGEAPAAPS